MITEIYHSRQNISYKYKLSIFMAIAVLCLSRWVLHGSEGEYELFRYLIPLAVGGAIGYVLGYCFDTWQKSFHLSRKTNITRGKDILEHQEREAWHAPLFAKNHCILLLLNGTTGLIEEANPRACEFYGYSMEQFKRMHISEIFSLAQEDRAGRKDTDQMARTQAIPGKKLFSRHKLASGEEREVELFSGSIVIHSISFQFLVISDRTEQKVLQGILPICAHCKQIRNSDGDWSQVEEYIQHHSEANFSHGLCPSCAQQHYPTIYEAHQPAKQP